jgi:ribosome biogenesis protein SSF1/2
LRFFPIFFYVTVAKKSVGKKGKGTEEEIEGQEETEDEL